MTRVILSAWSLCLTSLPLAGLPLASGVPHTAASKSRPEQPLASGAPRTATDHSNLILPMTEIGGIFGISKLVVPRGQFILVKIQVVGNRGDQGKTKLPLSNPVSP